LLRDTAFISVHLRFLKFPSAGYSIESHFTAKEISKQLGLLDYGRQKKSPEV